MRMPWLDKLVRLARGTIRRQLTLAFALATSLVMFGFGYGVLQHQSKFLMEQSVRSAEDLAHMVAVGSTAWIVANDLPGLQDELRSITRNPNLRYALVLAGDGRVLAANDAATVGRSIDDPLSKNLLASQNTKAVILVDSERLVDAPNRYSPAAATSAGCVSAGAASRFRTTWLPWRGAATSWAASRSSLQSCSRWR